MIRFQTTLTQWVLLLMLIGISTGCRNQATAEGSQSPTLISKPSRSTARPGNEIGTLTRQGQPRTYVLHTPKSYRSDRPLPIVIAFHGYGSQGKDLAASSGLNDLADQQGFLVVYPDGLDRRWNLTQSLFSQVDDVGFVSALIDHLTQIRAVDSRRIYAMGVSNGGFLVQRLACESSSRIAAFASVVATLPASLQTNCKASRPVSMLMMNGTDDRKVPWQGGRLSYGEILSVPASIEFWQQRNQCSTKSRIKRAVNDRVDLDRHPNCQAGSEVELVTLKGVGHLFPRGGSGPNSLINGSEEIWTFFQRHPLK